MQKYIYIAIGGGIGAILRYLVKTIPIVDTYGSIPVNTLIVNMTGCFALALILTIALQILKFDANVRLGIATGLLGGFTTFSTLCKETATLFLDGFYLVGCTYVILTLLLGLGAGYLGIALANKIVGRTAKRKSAGTDSVPGEGEV